MKRGLKRQLQASGAKPEEARELAKLAAQLQEIGLPKLSADSKQRIAQEVGISKPLYIGRLTFSGGLVAMVIMLLVAQSALPGTTLYAFKRRSERVWSWVDPNFEEKAVDRRKGELDALKRRKAEQERIEEAQEEYERALDRSGRRGGEDRDDEDERKDEGSSGRGRGRGRSGSGDDGRNDHDDKDDEKDDSGSGSDDSEDEDADDESDEDDDDNSGRGSD